MPLLDAAVRMATMPARLSVAAAVPVPHASVDAPNRAVEPLSGLATRVPGRRRRTAIEA